MNKNELNKLVAMRIKTARKSAGLSLAQLTEKIGDKITRQALYRYEKGEIMPPQERIEKIAEITGYPVSFFFKPITTEVTIGEINFHKIDYSLMKKQ